jgi:hypothetical protein
MAWHGSVWEMSVGGHQWLQWQRCVAAAAEDQQWWHHLWHNATRGGGRHVGQGWMWQPTKKDVAMKHNSTWRVRIMRRNAMTQWDNATQWWDKHGDATTGCNDQQMQCRDGDDATRQCSNQMDKAGDMTRGKDVTWHDAMQWQEDTKRGMTMRHDGMTRCDDKMWWCDAAQHDVAMRWVDERTRCSAMTQQPTKQPNNQTTKNQTTKQPNNQTKWMQQEWRQRMIFFG